MFYFEPHMLPFPGELVLAIGINQSNWLTPLGWY